MVHGYTFADLFLELRSGIDENEREQMLQELSKTQKHMMHLKVFSSSRMEGDAPIVKLSAPDESRKNMVQK